MENLNSSVSPEPATSQSGVHKMFCSKCGAASDGGLFCSSCGASLQVHASVSPKPDISLLQVNSSVSLEPAVSIYAGLWKRVVAILIDSIILLTGGAVVAYIVEFIIGIILGLAGVTLNTIAANSQLINVSVSVVITLFYYTQMESSSKQATFGKMAMGIIVTDLKGNRISSNRAYGRCLGKILSGLFLGLGYIMAGFTLKKQALHDFMAGTLVVKKHS